MIRFLRIVIIFIKIQEYRQEMETLIGKTINSYNFLKIIGYGQSGIVFKAQNTKTNTLVAIKAISQHMLNTYPKMLEQISTEISVLAQIHNPNVISYYQTFKNPQFLFIVLELCNGGSVDQYLQVRNVSEQQAIIFLKQILNGFKGIHQAGAMHRDFKSANILLHDGVCKIADLGSSKVVINGLMAKSVIGTPSTKAPEILKHYPYGFEVDIWSIGIVFYHMLYGRYPWRGDTEEDLLYNIRARRPNYQCNGVAISGEARDFLERCLTVDPNKRMQWNQIYLHPLITGKNGGTVQQKVGINIKQNLEFYQKPEGLDLERAKKTLKQIPITQVQEKNSEKEQIISNIKNIITYAHHLRKIMQITERFDGFYNGKRDDLRFYSQFVQPYIGNFQRIRANHSTAAFLMAKNQYINLSKFGEAIEKQKVIFSKQPGFEQYVKTENYLKTAKKIEADMQQTERYCIGLRNEIKMTSLEISQELSSIKQAKNSNYESFTKNCVGEYCRLLVQGLSLYDNQSKEVDRGSVSTNLSPNRNSITSMNKDSPTQTESKKVNLLKLISALDYFRSTEKIYSHEFNRILETTKIEDLEKIMKSKYYF